MDSQCILKGLMSVLSHVQRSQYCFERNSARSNFSCASFLKLLPFCGSRPRSASLRAESSELFTALWKNSLKFGAQAMLTRINRASQVEPRIGSRIGEAESIRSWLGAGVATGHERHRRPRVSGEVRDGYSGGWSV